MSDLKEIKNRLASLSKDERKRKLRKAVTNLNEIIQASSSLFCEREDAIHTAVVCLITGTHHLQYGPAGTAKSMLTRFLNERIEGSAYFERLLTKSSDESLLFGPYSLKGLENDEYKRNVAGKLPEANIAFIDEIYKCNSATLNAMLGVMNEKIYHNGENKPLELPLISLFGASNEIPEEDSSLEALHDRFLMRLYIDDIKEPSNMVTVYKNNLDNAFDEADLPTVTIDDIFLLNEYTKKIKIPDMVLNEYSKTILDLRNKGIRVSTRRQVNLLRAVQGEALLNKRNTALLDDFKIIRNGLWRKLEEMIVIDTTLAKFISPYESQYNELLKKFKDYKIEYDSLNGTDTQSAIQKSKIVAKMNDMSNQIGDYIKINSGMPRVTQQTFKKLYNEITNYTEAFYEEQDKDLLDLSPRSGAKRRTAKKTPLATNDPLGDDDEEEGDFEF